MDRKKVYLKWSFGCFDSETNERDKQVVKSGDIMFLLVQQRVARYLNHGILLTQKDDRMPGLYHDRQQKIEISAVADVLTFTSEKF